MYHILKFLDSYDIYEFNIFHHKRRKDKNINLYSIYGEFNDYIDSLRYYVTFN